MEGSELRRGPGRYRGVGDSSEMGCCCLSAPPAEPQVPLILHLFHCLRLLPDSLLVEYIEPGAVT